ncbi:hypothetical protein [Halobellus salinisoli]|uniref:hypothetical protein n=1 Tax=Halobellus salinisoli TaxID=3108500 RepID=UPI003009BA86
MLDSDVSRIRADRLRAFIDERKRDAETDRIAAIEEDRTATAIEETCRIEAYEEVLGYIDSRCDDGDSLVRVIRD